MTSPASITRQSALPLAELDKQAGIHVSKTTHSGFMPLSVVLVDGDFYYANPLALASLRMGCSPEDLQLEPAPDEEE